MKSICPFVLVVLAVGLSSACAADGDAADKAIRGLAERYYAGYAAKDVDAVMALWSEKSPDYDGRKKDLTELFTETGRVTVKRLTVVRVHRDGDAALVRVRVELAGDDARTGAPHAALGAQDRVLALVLEGGKWKVMHYGPTARRLMDLLVAAETKEERLRLLDEDADLVGTKLVLKALNEGDAEARAGRFEEASHFQDVAFLVAEGLGDRAALAWCHLDCGLHLFLQSRYESALACYQKALPLFREANDRVGEEAALHNMGNVYEATGRYTEAMQRFQETLAIARDLGDRAGEAGPLNNIGLVWQKTGRYAEALRHYQQALQIERDLSDPKGEAETLNNMGAVFAETGRYAEALRQHEDSLRIAREVGDRAVEAATLANIGQVYSDAGLYGEALQRFQDSLTITRDLDDRAAEAHTLADLAGLYGTVGRNAESLRQYQDCLAIQRELGAVAAVANTLCNIGVVYQKAGRNAEALRQYQDGLKIARDLNDRAGEAWTLGNIGSVYLRMGRHTEARQRLEEGLRLAQAIGALDIAVSCHGNLGRTYQAQKQWLEAVQAYEEAVRATERLRTNTREPALQSSLLARGASPYFLLAECQLELGAPAKAFVAAERMKARGLVDILQQGKADLRRGMSRDERLEEQRLQDQSAALGVQLEDMRGRKADAQAVAVLVGDQEKARQNLEEFHRALYLHRPDLATRRAEFAPAAPDDLGSTLFAARPRLAVLSYLVGEKETLLFVLTPGERDGGPPRLSVHRIDVGSEELAEAVDAFRAACADPAAAAPDGDELYRWLIAPAAGELAAAKQLVIVPDGPLHTLPFQALQDPDGAFLMERLAVSYAPSVTALTKMEGLAAARRKEYAGRPPSLLAVGVADFGLRERPLPAALAEARTAAGAFGEGGKLLQGTEATRAQVEAAWGAYRYLHFATHGRLNSDAPLYSALVLSPGNANDEGVLYARDLADSDVPAELAVMSACETGLGRRMEGEGLLGLSWSWFAAGVPSTVASQWSVGDASTARLMKTFYARLAAGDAKAEALRQAELALLADPATRHPFYWAPFVLVGDDR